MSGGGLRWPWQASPAQMAAWQRYEERHPERRALKVQQQRDRRRREKEAAAQRSAYLASLPEAIRDEVTGVAERRRQALEDQKARAEARVRSYLRANRITAHFTCDDQRTHQRLGKLGCSYCGGNVRSYRPKDGDGFFACARCGQQPVCACCFRSG